MAGVYQYRDEIENNDYYFYVNAECDVEEERFERDDYYYSMPRASVYNCFKTEIEAKREAVKVIRRRQLEAIAEWLNRYKEINWTDKTQAKYYLYYSYDDNMVKIDFTYTHRVQGVVYCLNDRFLDESVQWLTKSGLELYLKGIGTSW